MSLRSTLTMSISGAFALLCLAGCEDACHDGDPSTCCCRDRRGLCRDPSNGDLPDPDVTCTESRSSSNTSSAPVTTPPPPAQPQLPAPSTPSGIGNSKGWEWTVVVGGDYPVKLCCAVGDAEPSPYGNCQEVNWTQTKIHTDLGQILSCRTYKAGWTPSPVATIGYTGF